MWDQTFLKAPSKKAIEEAGVRIIKRCCTSDTPLISIELGKKYRFHSGDPIEFVGKPTEVVILWKGRHERKFLKIIVGDKKEVVVYSEINFIDFCRFIEIIEETKE